MIDRVIRVRARMPQVRLVALLIGVLTLVAAGCGGGDGRLSKNEYVEKNNEIQQAVADATSTLGSSGGDVKTVKAEAAKMQDEMDSAVAEMKQLKPPSEWQDEHDSMVAALEGMSEVMADVGAAAEKQDVKALTATMTKMNEHGESFSKAVASINESR